MAGPYDYPYPASSAPIPGYPAQTLTGSGYNYPYSGAAAASTPASPPIVPPATPTPLLPERNPLNDSLAGKDIMNYTDTPVMGPDDKPIPGEFVRTIIFRDGSTRSYEYSAQDDPENYAGRGKEYIPAGAKFIGEGENTGVAKNYNDREALRVAQERAKVYDEQQNATIAGNQASQTGYVMVPGPDGNPILKLDAQGNPIPTLGREQFNRQTAAQEAATGVQKEQNQITRERNAAQALYEQAQLDATKERDRINAQVALGTLNANKAKEQFDEWMQINVTIPFKQMEEARARATEARQAQALEDQRRQNAAQFEQERNKTALGVGNEMVKATVATLPYMSGPNWGSQFGNALSAVANGRPQDIHFDASGLNFQAPDFQKIAEQATARALAHLSPYAAAIAQAGDRPGGAYATTDYSQVPNIPSAAGAPTSQSMGGYTPAGMNPVVPTVAPADQTAGMPVEQWR